MNIKKSFGMLHPIWCYNIKEELKEDYFNTDKKRNNYY